MGGRSKAGGVACLHFKLHLRWLRVAPVNEGKDTRNLENKTCALLGLFGAFRGSSRSISVQEDVLAEALARFGPRFERQMRISLGKLAERVGMPPYCLVDFLVEKKTY